MPNPHSEDAVPVNEDALLRRVRDILTAQFGVPDDKITMETRIIEDLGADSLDTIEIVMEIEDCFDIAVPDDEAEKIVSVSDIVAYLVKNA